MSSSPGLDQVWEKALEIAAQNGFDVSTIKPTPQLTDAISQEQQVMRKRKLVNSLETVFGPVVLAAVGVFQFSRPLWRNKGLRTGLLRAVGGGKRAVL